MELLKEHLMLAMFLGALAVGFLEGLKNRDFFTLTGTKLGLFATVFEVAVAGGVGFYYLGIAGTDLIAIMILVLFNAETIYAVYKRLTDIAEGKVEAGE